MKLHIKKKYDTKDDNILLFIAQKEEDGSIGILAENEQGDCLGMILSINQKGYLSRTENLRIVGLPKNNKGQIMLDEEYLANNMSWNKRNKNIGE